VKSGAYAKRSKAFQKLLEHANSLQTMLLFFHSPGATTISSLKI
jgi:hypothetical protein